MSPTSLHLPKNDQPRKHHILQTPDTIISTSPITRPKAPYMFRPIYLHITYLIATTRYSYVYYEAQPPQTIKQLKKNKKKKRLSSFSLGWILLLKAWKSYVDVVVPRKEGPLPGFLPTVLSLSTSTSI